MLPCPGQSTSALQLPPLLWPSCSKDKQSFPWHEGKPSWQGGWPEPWPQGYAPSAIQRGREQEKRKQWKYLNTRTEYCLFRLPSLSAQFCFDSNRGLRPRELIYLSLQTRVSILIYHLSRTEAWNSVLSVSCLISIIISISTIPLFSRHSVNRSSWSHGSPDDDDTGEGTDGTRQLFLYFWSLDFKTNW